MILLAACTPPDSAAPVPVDPPVEPAVAGRASWVSPEELGGGGGEAFTATLTAAASVDGYAYNEQVPGPTVRVEAGRPVTLTLHNGLADATTIHWHGLRVPEAMDGAGWVDGGVVAGDTFSYEFVPLDPGTYWYHPHLDVSAQVDLGLYGMFIVEDPEEPVADRDLVVVFDAREEHDTDTDSDTDAHALSSPAHTVWKVNGQVDPLYTATAGQRIRVRMLNASNTAYLALHWPDMRVIAGDQGLYAAPEAAEVLVLAPGDRAEAEWDLSVGFDVVTAPWVASGGSAIGEDMRLFSVDVEGTAAAEPIAWPTADATPTEDPSYTDLTYVFQGGGAGDWMINGEVWPDVTVQTLPLDVDSIVEVRNLSSTNHPFHLHGQRFEVLSVDGVPVPARRIEDTVDVGVRQRVRLRVRADNPGDWLVHCHLLAHEEGGMMTRVRVE